PGGSPGSSSAAMLESFLSVTPLRLEAPQSSSASIIVSMCRCRFIVITRRALTRPLGVRTLDGIATAEQSRCTLPKKQNY
ncbi:hypothetical protein KUCAC02_025229, partial [Chaenocephalus aceratus]